jgi:NAD(P)H-dependent FMN reductase
MSFEPVRVAVIVGSIREQRFGATVANWFLGHAKQRADIDIDLVDLVDVPLPAVLGTAPPPELVATLGDVALRLDLAEAFVVVTPEYNHSFPASLKNAIDWHYTQWRAKPVGFVSYGGMGGGLRSVEHLRLVFAELHAITIRETVSFHNAWDQFDSGGQPREPQGCAEAARIMLDQLVWFGLALREARAKRPYAV